ncbi:hypothetical protein B5S32_g5021 [[Candida] boidinii]|nr:hypothetical protein B5S32_g5021 [[Candida] boidinii]
MLDSSVLITPISECQLFDLPETREKYLEKYSKRLQNISKLNKPPIFSDLCFLKPPDSYHEGRRLMAVERFIGLPHWEDKEYLNKIILKSKKIFQSKAASISIVDSDVQLVKAENNLGLKKCSRSLSLDGHAILSKDYFLLLDASKDWRTMGNPFVKCNSGIKFYCGIPLIEKETNQAFGVLSVLDSIERTQVSFDNILKFQKVAAELLNFLRSPYKVSASDINSISDTKSLLKSGSVYFDKEKVLKHYGRASSRGDSQVASSIYERDQSGTRYLFDTEIQINQQSHPDNSIERKIENKLRICRDFLPAVNMLCRFLIKQTNSDCAFVVRQRFSQLLKIDSSFFPMDSIPYSEFKHKSHLKKIAELRQQHEIITMEGLSDHQQMNQVILNELGERAYRTPYGIGFVNNTSLMNDKDKAANFKNNYCKNSSKYVFNSGCVFCFYEKIDKLIKKKENLSANDSKSAQHKYGREINVYHKYGGFTLFLLRKSDKALSESEIGRMFRDCTILKKVYLDS